MTASNRPKTVILTFHHEEGSWWADSHQMPSLFAGGDNLDDAKGLARQAVVDEFGDEVLIAEWMPAPDGLASIVGYPNEESASEGESSEIGDIKSWPEEEDPSKAVEPDIEFV
jgi:hypothetical protein